MGFRGILWTNLGRPVRLGPVDGRALFFIILAVYHWALWTFGLAILGMIGLFWIERLGYSIPNLVRRLSVFVMGKHRPTQSSRSIRSDQ